MNSKDYKKEIKLDQHIRKTLTVLILNPTIWYLADLGPIFETLKEHIVKERKKEKCSPKANSIKKQSLSFSGCMYIFHIDKLRGRLTKFSSLVLFTQLHSAIKKAE